MSNLVICSVGNDLYDHSACISHEILDTPAGGWDITSDAVEVYFSHCKDRIRRGIWAWVTVSMIDIDTGKGELLLQLRNPEKKRIEVNLPAKKAKEAKTSIKRVIPATLGMNDTAGFWTVDPMPSSADINTMLNNLAAQQVEQT